MARSQKDLQTRLLKLAPKAWFKRPPDNKMSYPCFIYRQSKPMVGRANNKAYLQIPCWNVIYITHTPSETIIPQMLEEFECCDFDREYEADELFHYSFTIYF